MYHAALYISSFRSTNAPFELSLLEPASIDRNLAALPISRDANIRIYVYVDTFREIYSILIGPGVAIGSGPVRADRDREFSRRG